MYEILQEKLHNALVQGIILNNFQEFNSLLVQQYELVVKQNRCLQQELINLKKQDSGESTK